MRAMSTIKDGEGRDMSGLYGYWQLEAIHKKREKRKARKKQKEAVRMLSDDYMPPVDLTELHSEGCELKCLYIYGGHCACCEDDGEACCACGFEPYLNKESCTCVELLD